MSTSRRATELLLTVFLPGLGGTIYQVVTLMHDLANEVQSSKTSCNQVLKRIESLLNQVEKIQDAHTLDHNDTLQKLATTIVSFIAFMKAHQMKHVFKRFCNRKEAEDRVQAFHLEIDALFQELHLTEAAKTSEWREKFEMNRQIDYDNIVKKLASTEELLKLLKSRPEHTLPETLFNLKAAVENNSVRISEKDMKIMRKTIDALLKHSGMKLQHLQPWYISSDEIKCDKKHFAKGTYGSVHRGTCNGARVVIKKLLVPVNDSVERDFQHEVTVWHAINNHAHILRLFGACHVAKAPFFVCEDATGGNFVEYFSDATNKKRFLWRRFHEAALGLLHLHKTGAVHGDLKGGNLLVGADGVTKICDFGFSFIRSESKSMSIKAQTNAVRWQALECMDGDEHTTETPQFKSDVYSLGMCIIEVVGGVEPWEYLNVSGNSQELEDKIYDALNNQVRHPRPDGFTDDQWKLVDGMTSIDKLARMPLGEVLSVLKGFASIEELSQKLASTTLLACSKCNVTYNGPVKFCNECGFSFRASHAAEPGLPSTVAPTLLAPTATA